LLRDSVAERRRADLRHRQPAGGDDERRAAHRPQRRRNGESFRRARDVIHGTRHPPLHVPTIALGLQHADDVLRRVVAEQLPELLFVIGDAVLLDQRDEVARRIPRKCRTAEVRVLRKEVARTGPAVGEVAASPAGDADLLAQQMIVLDHQHAAAALTRLRRAHHAGRARADDDDIVVNHQDAGLIALGIPMRSTMAW